MTHTGRRTITSRVAALASLAWIYFSPVHAQTLDAIKTTIRKRFPEVRQLSTAELATWLQDTNRQPPLLVDARTEREFQVSHLRGAVNANSSEAVRHALVTPNAPVVVYCSVGYRSSALGEKLQKAGITNVWNLEGSIFAWANEGRPVYRGTAQVREVHPYDKKWGQMLKPELRARQ